MEKVSVPTNAGRLIHAVARIGYDTEVAVCDLVDNCIDADATVVRVDMEKREHEHEGRTDTISSYQIVDNGVGMDRKTLIDAFTLGTDRDYRPGSLGKFGLGLKSAGLSLGREITILTQKAGGQPICARLSMLEVEQSGKYEVDLGDVPNELEAVWNHAGIDSHGTVLRITDLTDGQPARSAFQDYLRRYCSIVYHRFMEREKPIRITVGGVDLVPFDPLFLQEAKANGVDDPKQLNPQTWDGKTPFLLLDDQVQLEGCPTDITVTHLVHPPSFGEAQHQKQERYGIASDPYTRRPRHGFYVYRNDRVIVLAERFHGVVPASTQHYAFRARLMFDESADAMLSLDVKKRHCQLPKDVRSNVKAMIGRYANMSREAWTQAGKVQAAKRGETRENRANASIATTTVASLDNMPGDVPDDDDALKQRKKHQEAISQEAIEAVQDTEGRNLLEKSTEDGDAVVLVEGLRSNAMWWPYPAVSLNKAETLVNKNHTWVAEAYRASEESPDITIVLHHLFTILARAELEVRAAPWQDINTDQVDKVFDRYRKRVSIFGEDLAEQLADALGGETVEGDE